VVEGEPDVDGADGSWAFLAALVAALALFDSFDLVVFVGSGAGGCESLVGLLSDSLLGSLAAFLFIFRVRN
jgi:hypothetical protein